MACGGTCFGELLGTPLLSCAFFGIAGCKGFVRPLPGFGPEKLAATTSVGLTRYHLVAAHPGLVHLPFIPFIRNFGGAHHRRHAHTRILLSQRAPLRPAAATRLFAAVRCHCCGPRERTCAVARGRFQPLHHVGKAIASAETEPAARARTHGIVLATQASGFVLRFCVSMTSRRGGGRRRCYSGSMLLLLCGRLLVGTLVPMCPLRLASSVQHVSLLHLHLLELLLQQGDLLRLHVRYH
mmetsp:Transcript_14881/g.61924  ORF Transcript_14881/g.61924 Transcript_14881/m.61924 type:complete len:239 (-) Transcript_14881:956-1672(-)